jgi:hypothetical protein
MTDRELDELLIDAIDSSNWEMVYKAQQALRDRLAHPESVHAIDISQERVDETEKDQHEDWCALLTQLLASWPPRPAPCNCKLKEKNS